MKLGLVTSASSLVKSDHLNYFNSALRQIASASNNHPGHFIRHYSSSGIELLETERKLLDRRILTLFSMAPSYYGVSHGGGIVIRPESLLT